MVETYRSLRDENGQAINGRLQLFIYDIQDDGEIGSALKGTSIVPECAGTLLVVDDYVAKQIDKLKFIDGQLTLKDGEELIVPEKSEKELQIEALKQQIAELENEEAIK